MNPPQDPRKHPLQDDEIALARVLRALPAGEPSPSVDAAILAAATDAVPRRRKPGAGLRWLPTWAVGTAAAAVLAVGIGIQLRPPLVPAPPIPASTSEQARELPPSRPRMAVDLAEPELAPIPPPAPPPSQPSASPRAVAPATPPPRPAPAAMPEVAEPPPSELVRQESAPAPFEDLGGFAPPPASAALSRQEADEEQATLDRIEVTGSRVQSPAATPYNRPSLSAIAEPAELEARAQAIESNRARRQASADAAAASREQAKAGAAALPAPADDIRLAPADWLDRIRDRQRRGDLAGARESLALFARTHPDLRVPDDLAQLR